MQNGGGLLDALRFQYLSELPVTEEDSKKLFCYICWHPGDQTPFRRLSREVVQYFVSRGLAGYQSKTAKITNTTEAVFIYLRELRYVDENGLILPEGREFLLSTHPKHSPIWLALKDIWNNKLALLITALGALSGLLAIAQWLGWLPQRL